MAENVSTGNQFAFGNHCLADIIGEGADGTPWPRKYIVPRVNCAGASPFFAKRSHDNRAAGQSRRWDAVSQSLCAAHAGAVRPTSSSTAPRAPARVVRALTERRRVDARGRPWNVAGAISVAPRRHVEWAEK